MTRAHTDYPEGKIVEYTNTNADEWPWSPDDSPPEWRVFGIPVGRLLSERLGEANSLT